VQSYAKKTGYVYILYIIFNKIIYVLVFQTYFCIKKNLPMIIYNVTISLDAKIQAEWLAWMRQTHIPEVMQAGGFLQYKICRLLHPEPEEGVTFAIQYTCDSMDILNEYTTNQSAALQKKHHDKFAGSYVAFRTILEIID
jgi:hypothetical protein